MFLVYPHHIVLPPIDQMVHAFRLYLSLPTSIDMEEDIKTEKAHLSNKIKKQTTMKIYLHVCRVVIWKWLVYLCC